MQASLSGEFLPGITWALCDSQYRLIHHIPVTCCAGLCFAGERQYLFITLADILIKSMLLNTSASVLQRPQLTDVLNHHRGCAAACTPSS